MMVTTLDSSTDAPPPPPPLNEVLRAHVIAVLTACDGNRTAAARALQIDRKTIYRMLLRWGLEAR